MLEKSKFTKPFPHQTFPLYSATKRLSTMPCDSHVIAMQVKSFCRHTSDDGIRIVLSTYISQTMNVLTDRGRKLCI